MSQHVLFEIGLEELPARFIRSAEEQLHDKTINWLDERRLTYKQVTCFSTPRRLAVLIDGIAEKQTSITKELRGPSEKIAKDKDGNWSKAALGFVRGQQQTTDDIYVKDVKNTPYIFVQQHIEGKETAELLPDFKDILASIHFPQTMRWGTGSFKYARPIRWLVAMMNDQIIPLEMAGIKSGHITYGHRFLGHTIELQHAVEYENKLRDSFVIAHPKERERMILEGFEQLEASEQWKIIVDDDLLHEVCNLVEYPTVFFGTFAKRYLELPAEVLITSMQEHQRYFPVTTQDGNIDCYFVGVRNGDAHSLETVVKGNEKVLHARLSDAEFFFDEDKKQSIETSLAKLERVVFQEKLGSTADKVKRVVRITKELTQTALPSLSEDTKTTAVRAAEICKFDLMTHMVNEFTELQGIMGEKYATYFGETKSVAKAIREHYLPKQANGDLPETEAGAIVSVADKIDTIVGFISIGLKPTGSQDPYGLRRQATGILHILQDRAWTLSFEELLNIALAEQQRINAQEVDIREIQDFFKLRARYLLQEKDIEQDVIRSVLASNIGYISYTRDKAQILSEKRQDHTFKFIEEALVRLVNLSTNTEYELNPSDFQTESEWALYEHYKDVVQTYEEAKKSQDAKGALQAIAQLAKPIHAFFEHNMVMADEEQIKNNRLALVNMITLLIHDFADLTEIEWKQHA